MSNAPKCKFCGKPATVHLTQIVEGQAQKMDLCESCAKAQGLDNPAGFAQLTQLFEKALADPIAEKMVSAFVGATDGSDIKCTVCGMTPGDFKKTGRLGCPHCYSSFAAIIEPMLGDMHRGTAHLGKVPTKSLERRSVQERLADLEKNLQDAIRTENYEEAAQLRDQLRQLRTQE